MSRRVIVQCGVCRRPVWVALVDALNASMVQCTRCVKRGGVAPGTRLCGSCNKPGHYKPKCPQVAALPDGCLCKRTWPEKNYGCPHHGAARASEAA